MKLFNLTKTYTGDIPPRSTVAVYCGAGGFRDACYQLVSAFLLVYISFAGVLSKVEGEYIAQIVAITTIMMVCRIWDAINDPIMGWIIEKVHFKWGKYKPWILLGAILNTVVVLCLFLLRPNGWAFVATFAVFYFLWDTVYTINDIAYWSMLPSLTRDEKRKNKITSIMQICISAGVFIMFGIGNILPTMFGDAKNAWTVISIVITTLFLISQIVLVFVCKEHKRDPKQEEKERQNVSFKDIIRVLKANKPMRVNMIGIFLQYLGAGMLVAFGTYYGYLVYGYGSTPWLGGFIVLLITVMYGIGTIVSQSIYTALAKRFNRKTILHMAIISAFIGYVIFLFTGFPILFDKTPAATGGLGIGLVFLFIGALLLFFGQGLISVVMLIQMQSTIEYNEYKFGERKEAVASSLRAFTAKISSSIQTGVVTGILAGSGLYGITQKISNLENWRHSWGGITDEEMARRVAEIIGTIDRSQLIILSIGMVVIPLLCIIGCYIIFAWVFNIDEKKYAEICDGLEKKHTTVTKNK